MRSLLIRDTEQCAYLTDTTSTILRIDDNVRQPSTLTITATTTIRDSGGLVLVRTKVMQPAGSAGARSRRLVG
jgi:hypothetical protein